VDGGFEHWFGGPSYFFEVFNYCVTIKCVKMEMWRVRSRFKVAWWQRRWRKVTDYWKKRGRRLSPGLAAILAIVASLVADAQDGVGGITEANTLVRSYFPVAVQLMYAIGGIVGIIGAVKVYQKWSHGDHDTGKVAAAWFGACIFLVVVASLLGSFFGV
jgi:Domain of unknown function (DUF4134)